MTYGVSTWRVWSTYVHLCVSQRELLPTAEAITRKLIAAVDHACSRFRPDSDLAKVNANPGRWTRVDSLLVEATRIAVAAAEQTDGLVDPCLGRTLTSWGYDVDLAVLRRRPAASVVAPEVTSGAWRELRWREDAVLVPDGCALDLGATAKAWTADLVALTVSETLGCGVLISLGGDIRYVAAGGPPWPVHVGERPDEAAETVLLHEGGLATSTTTQRRWQTREGWAHHLLDPRTGWPTDGLLRTVTAVGSTCVAANAATTAALVLGADAEPWLDARAVSARLVDRDGAVRRLGDWPGPERSAA